MNPGKIMVAFIIVSLILALYLYPHLWWISILLAVWFLMFQVIAISRWKHKGLFFKYTDYFYYLIIGVVLFVGSRHITSDIIDYVDSMMGKEVIEKRLKEIDAEIPKAEERAKAAREAVNNISQEQWTREAERNFPRKPEKQTTKMDGSNNDIIGGLLIAKQESQNALDSLKKDKQYLKDKIRILENKDAIFSSWEHIVMDYLIIPVLFLAGIALKLGKTTASFD